MRIGIITQKLENNFGGILQNYALQTVLKRMGHTPITIDLRQGDSLMWDIMSYIKNLVQYYVHHQTIKPKFARCITHRSKYTEGFIKKYISTTVRFQKLTLVVPIIYRMKCIVTGSDQVWRPKYNIIKYTFLAFTGNNVKKIAYAASFGVDKWEYLETQTKQCCKWIKSFNGVSTREASGVKLCEEYLNVKAEHVLDPTMLLSASDYMELCQFIPKRKTPFLFAYILDITEEKKNVVERIAKDKNLDVIMVSAENNISSSIEEWLSYFRDADYVVTDSFHGSVFSIIFRKEFNTIINTTRGGDRFTSLFSLFSIENRIITEKKVHATINWEVVNSCLEEMRKFSISFIESSLNK